MANNNLVRLQKFMAECGVASRRKSEELIEMGKVKVNGHVAHIGDKINPKKILLQLRVKELPRKSVCTILCSINREDMLLLFQMNSAEKP